MVNENNLEEYKKKFLEIMNKNRNLEEELAIVITGVLDLDFAYAFGYNSQEYLDTGELDYFLSGNSPVILTKADGKFHYTWSGTDFEKQVEEIREKYLQ